MPFGQYKNFAECEAAAKKKGIKSPGGYCASLEHKIIGHWPGEAIMRKHYKAMKGRV
jgi:hypothetical protein